MMKAMGGTSEEDKPVKQYEDNSWDDPLAHQLEELLTNNLLTNFRCAVKLIADQGYSEEVAEKAILSNCIVHGSKDSIANVVDAALGLLRKERIFGFRSKPLFDGLKSLADYTILEMVHMIRETKPETTVVEAMWTLLLNDFNLLHSCVEGGESVWLSMQGEQVVSTPKSGTLGSSCPDSVKQDKPNLQAASSSTEANPAPKQKPNAHDCASSVRDSAIVVQEAQVKLPGTSGEMPDQGSDEKSRVSEKGSSSSSRKKDKRRQKGSSSRHKS